MGAKRESETLMNALLPVAEEMLRQYGEFYPYGGYVKPDGTIVQVGASDPDTDQPKSKDLIYVLRSSLQDLAERDECKAIAMVFDVTVTLPNSERKSDAIQVSLEHSEGYSTEVFFPYQLVENKLVYGEMFAQQGKTEMFCRGLMGESDAGKQIIGKWRSDPADAEAIAEYGDVSLDFSRTGALTYTIHTEGKRQIMLLTYRIDGDVLVTDQPSDPKEERTRFRITSEGKLFLEHEYRPSTYVRVADSPSLPSSSVNPN
jgi:hypothetical protein